MDNINPIEIKNIPSERWEEWCTMFTNGNNGRLVMFQIANKEMEPKTLADDLGLVAIDYDPVGKGNRITISFGHREEPNRHIIDGPVKLMQLQDKNGIVVSVVIENTDEERSIIILK